MTKTSQLTGRRLDAAVALALGGTDLRYDTIGTWWVTIDGKDRALSSSWAQRFDPSTNWAVGGPIIEREGIELICNLTATEAARFKSAHADWQAFHRTARSTEQRSYATTPLIAAMRCFVRRALGDEIDIPEELL